MPPNSRDAHDELVRKIDHIHEHLLVMKQEHELQTKLLRRILHKEGKIMAAIEDLEAAVTRIEGVSDSVIALLTELSKEIALLQNNTQAQALADRVNAKADALAAAVEANPDPNPGN